MAVVKSGPSRAAPRTLGSAQAWPPMCFGLARAWLRSGLGRAQTEPNRRALDRTFWPAGCLTLIMRWQPVDMNFTSALFGGG